LQGKSPVPNAACGRENQRQPPWKGVLMQKKYEICLRLTQEEKERLESDARRCGLSKTAYLRRLVIGAQVKARPSQEIKDLRTEVHHIGNNINQIARSVNAGIASAEDAKRGLYLLDQVYELMYQIAKK
jgi:predicted DNA-binding protein